MTAAQIIPERVEKLRGVVPETGKHAPPPNGTPVGCEVELLSWAAGMKWSDHTPCISPVIAAFLRRWNDDLDEEGRARLHAHCLDRIADLTSTGGDGLDEARVWLATDWLVRVCAPAWLELAGVEESPVALRALPPVTADTVEAAQPILIEAWKAGGAAWDAAAWDAAGDAAAWDAAGDAAWAAAWDAARAAARDAAWAAAWDAAWAAAWDAARAAARDAAWAAAGGAAWDAAGDAARAALKPTVQILQGSALGLLDRMIDVEAV